MYQINVYEAACCSPQDTQSVYSDMNEKQDMSLHRVSLLQDAETITVPTEVMSALLSYGEKALPIITINGKVAMKGGAVSESRLLRAIEKFKQIEKKEALSVAKLFQPIIPQKYLLSVNNLDYGIITPQCCSTTYFCACSST